MAEIDTRFVDLDLSEPPEDQGTGALEFDDDEQLMAAEAGIPGFGESFPQFMVPRSEWQERSEATAIKYRATTRTIYSQGRTSACVGFGTAQALETFLVRQYGARHYVQLAGMDVYSWIGNTLMSGAYIPDGIRRVADHGCLPLDTPENRERYGVVRGRLDYTRRRGPSGWQDVAKQFRVTRWAKCTGADEIASALICGFTGTVGRSRHCVPYTRLVYNTGKFYAGYANSWGNWGDAGWGYDSERVFDRLTMYAILDVHARPDLELPSV